MVIKNIKRSKKNIYKSKGGKGCTLNNIITRDIMEKDTIYKGGNPEAFYDLNQSLNPKLGGGINNNSTFAAYLNKLHTKYDITGDSDNYNYMSIHKGSGYTSDPSEHINGKPIIKPYDDCCPPALINGQYNFNNFCGYKKGGAKAKHKTLKTKLINTQKSRKYNVSKNNLPIIKFKKGGAKLSYHSNPANYNNAFNGQPNNFNLVNNNYNELQPNFTPNAI